MVVLKSPARAEPHRAKPCMQDALFPSEHLHDMMAGPGMKPTNRVISHHRKFSATQGKEERHLVLPNALASLKKGEGFSHFQLWFVGWGKAFPSDIAVLTWCFLLPGAVSVFVHIVFAIEVAPCGFPWMSQHYYGARRAGEEEGLSRAEQIQLCLCFSL